MLDSIVVYNQNQNKDFLLKDFGRINLIAGIHKTHVLQTIEAEHNALYIAPNYGIFKYKSSDRPKIIRDYISMQNTGIVCVDDVDLYFQKENPFIENYVPIDVCENMVCDQIFLAVRNIDFAEFMCEKYPNLDYFRLRQYDDNIRVAHNKGEEMYKAIQRGQWVMG